MPYDIHTNSYEYNVMASVLIGNKQIELRQEGPVIRLAIYKYTSLERNPLGKELYDLMEWPAERLEEAQYHFALKARKDINTKAHYKIIEAPAKPDAGKLREGLFENVKDSLEEISHMTGVSLETLIDGLKSDLEAL